IVELACLADDDRTRTDDEDRFDVGTFWHGARSTVLNTGRQGRIARTAPVSRQTARQLSAASGDSGQTWWLGGLSSREDGERKPHSCRFLPCVCAAASASRPERGRLARVSQLKSQGEAAWSRFPASPSMTATRFPSLASASGRYPMTR